jgi:hypothetical protein
MRRFIIKTTLKGNMELVYDLRGMLLRIDFNGVEVSKEVIDYVKAKAPVHVEHVYEAFAATRATVEEVDFQVTFADFRKQYPYTRNAHLAEKIWPLLSNQVQYKAYIEAIEYRKYCERNNTWYKPKMADKWLKEEQYKNDWKTL